MLAIILKAVLWSQNFLIPLRLRLSNSFGSGSGSSSGSKTSFVTTTFYHRFHIKKWIFLVFLWKNINLLQMLASIQYKFLFHLLLKLTRSQSREPEPKLRLSGSSSGSGQKLRLLAAPAPQHCLKALHNRRGDFRVNVATTPITYKSSYSPNVKLQKCTRPGTYLLLQRYRWKIIGLWQLK